MNEDHKREATTLEELLVQKMHERQMSITALARGAGIAKQTIHRYLDGTRPSLENCRKLSFFLNVPISKIVALTHPDVDGMELQSLVEMYLELPLRERHLASGILFLLLQDTKQQRKM